MGQGKRRGRREWEDIFVEQVSSGLSVAFFCRDKAIGLTSFYHWRRRLCKMEPVGEITPSESFIDMGQIDSSGSLDLIEVRPWVVTLELGDGLKLTLQRG